MQQFIMKSKSLGNSSKNWKELKICLLNWIPSFHKRDPSPFTGWSKITLNGIFNCYFFHFYSNSLIHVIILACRSKVAFLFVFSVGSQVMSERAPIVPRPLWPPEAVSGYRACHNAPMSLQIHEWSDFVTS